MGGCFEICSRTNRRYLDCGRNIESSIGESCQNPNSKKMPRPDKRGEVLQRQDVALARPPGSSEDGFVFQRKILSLQLRQMVGQALAAPSPCSLDDVRARGKGEEIKGGCRGRGLSLHTQL
jgi:hypothetical protein